MVNEIQHIGRVFIILGVIIIAIGGLLLLSGKAAVDRQTAR